MDVGDNESNIEYYHQRKRALLRAILEIPPEEEIYCEHCGEKESEKLDEDEERAEWHVHHVQGDGRTEADDSGWDCLYKHEEDYRDGKELMVVDKFCHKVIHENEELDDSHLH